MAQPGFLRTFAHFHWYFASDEAWRTYLAATRCFPGAWLRAAQVLSACASRRWTGDLAYQFVTVCRSRSLREASTTEGAGARTAAGAPSR